MWATTAIQKFIKLNYVCGEMVELFSKQIKVLMVN
jgi:hypothetical protein